jgi:hypothetical protein
MSMQIYSVVFCHILLGRQCPQRRRRDKEEELSYFHPTSVLEQGSVQVEFL